MSNIKLKIQFVFLPLILILISSHSVYANQKIQYGAYNRSTFSDNKKNEVVIVNWYSEEGIKRLESSQYKNDFYQLAHHFQPQINPLYCGMASSVIVLNALRKPSDQAPSQTELEIQGPKAWGSRRASFRAYSQTTFLNDKTDQVKSRAVIRLENITAENTNDRTQFDPGVTLAQLKGILEAYDLAIDLKYAKEKVVIGNKIFRQDLKKALQDSHQFIIVNFKGRSIGATTGGHISPIAAYDQVSDSVLVLDVAGHKNPWYWVPVAQLYQAMHTMDIDNHRGWLVIRDNLK